MMENDTQKRNEKIKFSLVLYIHQLFHLLPGGNTHTHTARGSMNDYACCCRDAIFKWTRVKMCVALSFDALYVNDPVIIYSSPICSCGHKGAQHRDTIIYIGECPDGYTINKMLKILTRNNF